MSVQVGVFCGSNVGGSPEYLEQARRLGSAIARRGMGLVYGGGRVGLMGAVADAVLEHGGEVTGVITDQLVGAEIAHPGVTVLEVVTTMHERKARMAEMSNGFIALPGGFGTLDETLEILTWNQLGLIAKPVAFLDVEGYFAGLFDFLDQAVEAQFVRGAHRMLAQRARTVDEAIAIVTGPSPETPHKWIDRDGVRVSRANLRASTNGSTAALVEDMFARPAGEGVSLAVVVVQHGEVVTERYGVQPPNLLAGRAAADHRRHAPDLVEHRQVDHPCRRRAARRRRPPRPRRPGAVPKWAGTEKEAITVLDLLELRSGLRFVEDYVDVGTSDVIEMLFGAGIADHAAFAADMPLLHPPGTSWSYASGSTMIICRIVGDILSGGTDAAPSEREAAVRAYLDERLLTPIGMAGADPRFDDAGNWVGSSYLYATAREFARFGELYLRDGCVGDLRVLPEGWVEHARTYAATDPLTGVDYGRHWWMWPDQPGSLAAHGYEGQYVLVLPEHDAVVVHLGKTDASVREPLRERLRDLIAVL